MDITKDIPTYYINLDESTDRNISIINTLNKVGFSNITRIPAIDTRTDDLVSRYQKYIDPEAYQILQEDNKAGKRRYFGSLTNGSIGCFLSHLAVFDRILRNGDQSAVIFEDDAIISIEPDVFWQGIRNMDAPLGDTHMYLLNAVYLDGIRRIFPGSNTVQPSRFMGTHAYFITREGALILSEKLRSVKYQIDFQMSLLIKAGKINIYGYDGPAIVYQDQSVFKTTLQNLHCKDCYHRDVNNDITEYFSDNASQSSSSYEEILVFTTVVIFLLISVFIVYRRIL